MKKLKATYSGKASIDIWKRVNAITDSDTARKARDCSLYVSACTLQNQELEFLAMLVKSELQISKKKQIRKVS
jgi:hypothetical protein